jgi:predicted transcriptional regulator
MIDRHSHVLRLSAEIVTAQVGHNDVESAAIPDLIRSVYNTLVAISLGDTNSAAPIAPPEDAVHVHDHAHEHGHAELEASDAHNVYVHPTYGETVFDDHLICMEDGLPMKMLKRHLLAVHGMTPEEYREKWGLPDDYPMVAAEYAKLRSNLAVKSGLGLKPGSRKTTSRKGR